MVEKTEENGLDKGMEGYGFSFAHEFRIYKTMCRLDIRKKQPYLCDNYAAWEKYVEEKYKTWHPEKLKSFSFYLGCKIYVLEKHKYISDKIIPAISCVFSGFLTIMLSEFITDTTQYFGNFISNAILSVLILYIFIIAFLSVWIIKYSDKQRFLSDYKRVVTNIYNK